LSKSNASAGPQWSKARLKRDLPEQAILGTGHSSGEGGGGVVEAGEMEQTVEGVEEDLVLDVQAVTVGLLACDGGADEDFPVGEGDDVGFGRVAKKIGMDLGHDAARDEDDFDYLDFLRQGTGQEGESGVKPPPKRMDP